MVTRTFPNNPFAFVPAQANSATKQPHDQSRAESSRSSMEALSKPSTADAEENRQMARTLLSAVDDVASLPRKNYEPTYRDQNLVNSYLLKLNSNPEPGMLTGGNPNLSTDATRKEELIAALDQAIDTDYRNGRYEALVVRELANQIPTLAVRGQQD
jgi:hypothetical protein